MSMQSSPNNKPPLPEIPGYRLLRIIAEGATSVVCLAEQESLGRQVALKVMRADALDDEVSRRRFENEIRTIGRLDHPNIVGIHQIGRTADDRPFFVMPHMTRGHLGQRDLAGRPAGRATRRLGGGRGAGPGGAQSAPRSSGEHAQVATGST